MPTRRSFLLFSLAAVCAAQLFALTPRLMAQAVNAEAQLSGSVHDPNGGPIAKATVSLRDIDKNYLYTAATNSLGLYLFSNLPPGNYQLSAEAAGFAKYEQSGFSLTVGQTATIDMILKLGGVAETVEVHSQTPVIEPSRTEISQVIETQQIQSLPINGRLFTDFALLTPGVAVGHTSSQSPFTDPNVIRVSFGGQRDLDNAVTVDGADNINTANGSQRATPSQEAVSEFRVVNNSFGAEYGRALGGIVNIVTKSGSNTFHGSIYDYLQNSKINARSILTLPQFDEFRQNQFGATLGGPIRTDKTFFFVNYEGQRRAQSPTYPAVLVDNLAAINALKQSFGIAAENLNILKTNDVDNAFVKIDHQAKANHRLSLRYSIQDATARNLLVGETLDGGGIGAPSSGRSGLTRDQSLVGNWTWSVHPTLINSVLVQWARRNYGFPGTTGQPNLDVPNLLQFGHNFGAFDRYNESRAQFSDTLSWTRGKHYANFGFDSNYIRNFVIWPGFTPSRDIFASLDDLLASSPANWGRTPCPPPLPPILSAPCIVAFFWGAPIGSGAFDPTKPSPPIGTSWQNAYLPSQAQNFFVHLNHNYWGWFAQDQWHLSPKVTLNYGLRYDFETGLGFFVNQDYRGIQPRLGIAYSPNPKTVIRAGYGLFYDRYTLTFFFVPAPQRQPVITGLPTANNQQTGTWLLNSEFLGACPPSFLNFPPNQPPACPSGTVPFDIINTDFENFITQGVFPANQPYVQGGTSVDRNLRHPYSEQSSLEIDREVGKGLAVNVGYLFVAGHHLVRPIDLNVAHHIGVAPDGKDIYNFALRDPNIPPPPGGSNGTNGIFYFTDSTGNSAYHGMTLGATEKAGKYLQLRANYTFSKVLDDGKFLVFVDTPQSNDQRSLERAVSNQNVRHRFIASFTADAPQDSFLRNFQLSSIVTAQSPRGFTMFVGFDANNDGNPVNDRVGTSRRNAYLGDTLRTWDLRLSRAITLTERYKLNLAADVFDLLNRQNVDEVFGVYGTPDFCGSVPRHYGDATTLAIQAGQVSCPTGVPPVSSNFGTPRTILNPRQFQFSAKLSF